MNVEAINDPPELVVETAVEMEQDTEGTLSIELWDVDDDTEVLVFALATPPAHGVVEVSANQVTYAPHPGFSGTDAFELSVTDPSGDSGVTRVDVLVKLLDSDGDGVGDSADTCEGYDDLLDADLDGVADDCDQCAGDDVYGDGDLDGTCDDLDWCVGDDALGDSDLDGTCDDLDVCEGDDAFGDGDSDDVCDDLDVCEGDDGSGDADLDGTCDDLDDNDDNDDCLDVVDLDNMGLGVLRQLPQEVIDFV